MEAIFGLLGTVIGGVIAAVTNWFTTQAHLKHQSKLAIQECQEARRTARHAYLIGLMGQLQEACAEYEQYLAKYPNNKDVDQEDAQVEHAKIIGRAMSACLAVSDSYDNADWEACIDGGQIPANLDHEHEYNDCCTRYGNNLTFVATRRLTRNHVRDPEMVEVRRWGSYKDRNRNALADAAKRLAQFIADLA